MPAHRLRWSCLAGVLLSLAPVALGAGTPTPPFRHIRVDREVTPPTVSLDVKRASGRAVLTELARARRLSLVFHAVEEDREITARLDRLPWGEVLVSVCRAAGWAYRLEGTVLEVAPLGWFELGRGG